MEFYTMDRSYNQIDVIDEFNSGIWTERYYGDSEAVIVVPATPEMFSHFPTGRFLGERGAKEVLMIDTVESKEGNLTVSCSSTLSFMNNRFVRSEAVPQLKSWLFADNEAPGEALWLMLYLMTVGGFFFDVAGDDLFPNRHVLKLPITKKSTYLGGGNPWIVVAFEPLYDAMRKVAETYEIGMRLTLEGAAGMQFESYVGVDRSSSQSVNPLIQFSEDMDSLVNSSEIYSIKDTKTHVWTFAPAQETIFVVTALNTTGPVEANPWDVRAKENMAEDITSDSFTGDAAKLASVLSQRGQAELKLHRFARIVDGEIPPNLPYKYGTDYSLGDSVDMKGKTGIVNKCRVVEHIRAQDDKGFQEYPTLELID